MVRLSQVRRKEQLTAGSAEAPARSPRGEVLKEQYQEPLRLVLWVYNDIFAVSLMRELSERGLRVSQVVSMIRLYSATI